MLTVAACSPLLFGRDQAAVVCTCTSHRRPAWRRLCCAVAGTTLSAPSRASRATRAARTVCCARTRHPNACGKRGGLAARAARGLAPRRQAAHHAQRLMPAPASGACLMPAPTCTALGHHHRHPADPRIRSPGRALARPVPPVVPGPRQPHDAQRALPRRPCVRAPRAALPAGDRGGAALVHHARGGHRWVQGAGLASANSFEGAAPEGESLAAAGWQQDKEAGNLAGSTRDR